MGDITFCLGTFGNWVRPHIRLLGMFFVLTDGIPFSLHSSTQRISLQKLIGMFFLWQSMKWSTLWDLRRPRYRL